METALIWYDGRYWLANTFNPELRGGAWFASPIYETESGLEVRPAGGNWCYKEKGAIASKGLSTEQRLQVYNSWIKHLEFTCEMVSNLPNMVEEYKKEIKYFSALCKTCV